METEGLVPGIIVTAIGAAALGGPDALRVLLEFAGMSPVADIAICVFVIGMLTAHLLGVVLLVRFVRKASQPRAQSGGQAPRPRAPATDCFAMVTLVMSVSIAFFVSACLVVVPGGGLMSSARLVFGFVFAGKSPVAVIGAAGSLPFIMPLLRLVRNAGGAAPASRAGMARAAYLVSIGLLPFFICFFEPGNLDALGLFHGFFTNTFFGIGTATVVGTVLLARFSRRTAGAVVPAAATGTERFGKLRQNAFLVALVCIALAGILSVIQYACSA